LAKPKKLNFNLASESGIDRLAVISAAMHYGKIVLMAQEDCLTFMVDTLYFADARRRLTVMIDAHEVEREGVPPWFSKDPRKRIRVEIDFVNREVIIEDSWRSSPHHD